MTLRLRRAVAPCAVVLALALATGCGSAVSVTETETTAATDSAAAGPTKPEASETVAPAPSPEGGLGSTAAQTDVAQWCEAFFEFDDEPTTQRAERLFEAPPDAVATDLATLRPLLAAVASYDEADENAEQALATLRAEPSISAASAQVNEYVDNNC